MARPEILVDHDAYRDRRSTNVMLIKVVQINAIDSASYFDVRGMELSRNVDATGR